ncbi:MULTISPECIES: DUF6343 family protein [Micromonospora]|uniref:Uncharacterized protein n=1 Tax=Micromonospora haikouensis TaxID=686309 RepID=A0A1C4W612_9ACTN|nr:MULTISPECIES: DUF6343 family protein [Micromonospora]OON31008.1 hypothetical protein BSA16_13125 [Micromonospora sp. Rc5]SCE91650.1 hypothetical protein GA0070558_113127 [Micromonospora haikouensis]
MTRSQPRRARGTVGHAYSALNLRLVLAGFGLVTMVIFAVLAVWAGVGWLGVVCAVFAVVAAVDLVVIQRRRAARRRESPGARHSLFE